LNPEKRGSFCWLALEVLKHKPEIEKETGKVAVKVAGSKETGGISGINTPKEIVARLDEYVVGQKSAKRALAIALRDRQRRLELGPDMIDEVHPRNVLMIGSTGVGKTELSKRIALLSNSPFVKVEASKFTEVGYVGRDVESMITSLCDNSIEMIRSEKSGQIEQRAQENAERRILDLLFPRKKSQKKRGRNASGCRWDRTSTTDCSQSELWVSLKKRRSDDAAASTR